MTPHSLIWHLDVYMYTYIYTHAYTHKAGTAPRPAHWCHDKSQHSHTHTHTLICPHTHAHTLICIHTHTNVHISNRDYISACALVPCIATDAELSAQEQAVLDLLKEPARDSHPDALATCAQVALALADCRYAYTHIICMHTYVYMSFYIHTYIQTRAYTQCKPPLGHTRSVRTVPANPSPRVRLMSVE